MSQLSGFLSLCMSGHKARVCRHCHCLTRLYHQADSLYKITEETGLLASRGRKVSSYSGCHHGVIWTRFSCGNVYKALCNNLKQNDDQNMTLLRICFTHSSGATTAAGTASQLSGLVGSFVFAAEPAQIYTKWKITLVMKRWLNLLEVFYSVGSGGERTEKHLVTRVHLWCRSTYSTASLDVEKLIWCKSFAVSLICIFTSFKLTVLISPMLCWAGRTKNSSTFRRSKRHGWTKQISRHCNICRWNWQSLSKIKQWRFLPSSAEGCQLVSVQRHRHSEFDIRSDTLQASRWRRW